MIVNMAGGGRYNGGFKYRFYESEDDIRARGEDWEVAIILSDPVGAQNIHIGSTMPEYSSIEPSGRIVGVWLQEHSRATTSIRIAENIWIPLLNAYKLNDSGSGEQIKAFVYIPDNYSDLVNGYEIEKGWLALGNYLFTSAGTNPDSGCTLNATYGDNGYELYSTGSLTTSARSRMYTTQTKVKLKSDAAENPDMLYSKIHVIASVDQSYEGTNIRLGISDTSSSGGNLASSHYKLVENTPITAGLEQEITLDIPFNLDLSGGNDYYIAFGAYNSGSSSIAIPLRVKRWWLD